MPIDFDPDTPASDAPDPRKPCNGPDAAVFREEQIAEHVRYQRVADAAYQAAARESWDDAVPGLQLAWEEHKEKFPEQTQAAPRTQPDGGWVAADDRKLTPEQNAEAGKACADLRDEAR